LSSTASIKREQTIEKDHAFDKRQVAESFGRAAESYDRVAHFQRDVGYRLLDLLPEGDYENGIDLGCGTGYFTPELSVKLNIKQLVGIDLSEGMVAYAYEHRSAGCNSPIVWAVGDAENLPIPNNSVDIIFTSLAIQWCSDYQDLFAELYRVLKPGGIVAFSTLLEGTLKELASSWQVVDSYRHVNSFSDYSEVMTATQAAGFNVLHSEQYTDELQYDSVKMLTRELKMLGAHNVNQGRSMNVTGRERVRQFKQAYEQFRTPGGYLPASYEVLLGVLQKN
jgi:malonyl-CoA O-methyltransferase